MIFMLLLSPKAEGASGLRLHYSADFYAAYMCVRDPEDGKFAVVCRALLNSSDWKLFHKC